MDEQKERTRITQSGKSCAMNCAIQGVRFDLKTKDYGSGARFSKVPKLREEVLALFLTSWPMLL